MEHNTASGKAGNVIYPLSETDVSTKSMDKTYPVHKLFVNVLKVFYTMPLLLSNSLDQCVLCSR